LAFSPATLFRRLGELDWYRDTLHTWIGTHAGNAPLRVLDVGCACGQLCDHLHRSGHEVYGVDKSKAMIRAAGRLNPAVEFAVADAYRIPFAEETVDLVSAASLINIVAEPVRLLAQMARVCRPGGWVTLLFPLSGFSDHRLHKYIAALGLSGFSKAALHAWHRSAPKTSIEEVRALLEGAGLACLTERGYLNGMVASVSARKPDQKGVGDNRESK